MRPRLLRTLALCLLVGLGLLLFRWSGLGLTVPGHDIIFLIGLPLLLAIKPVRQAIDRSASWLQNLSPGRHRLFMFGLAILLVGHFLFAAWRGGRFWVPILHDEQMYLLQARQLASFHLAMPQHPFPDFFDAFYVLVRPVYASMYFPGTALAWVPAIWLDLPWVMWPLLIMTAVCLMTYVVAAQFVGRAGGVVAVLCILATSPMNFLPTMTMSHPLGALQGLTALYGWLRWRKMQKLRFAVLVGAALGWMAITRPLESIAFGVPIGLAVLGSFRLTNWRRMALHVVVAAMATMPFLVIQLLANKQITGHFTKLPIDLYVQQEFPDMTSMGTSKTGNFFSTSTLLQKQVMAETFVKPLSFLHANDTFLTGIAWRGRSMLGSGVAHPFVLILLPLGLALAVRDTRWRVLVAIAGLFLLAYTRYQVYLEQYTIQLAPILAILTLGGMVWLPRVYQRYGSLIRTSFGSVVALLSIFTLSIMPNNAFYGVEWEQMKFNYQTLPEKVNKPAIVFFKFHEGNTPHVEPVYNLESAWPDDASIIRVHDLGMKQNSSLLDYYAAKQPERQVYHFDRRTWVLRNFGNVVDVARKMHEAPATTQPQASSSN